MDKEYVLVPKDEFQEMVESYLMMLAGEAGGVDNWEWWGESISEFILARLRTNSEENARLIRKWERLLRRVED